ncbi:MAG: helicase, partial [Paenarthrobacter sp.]
MPSHTDETWELAIQTPAINDRSLAAGLAYAMGSRVSGITFDAATGLLMGKIRGTGPQPYSTSAKLVRKPSGWSCTVGICSCPVRKDCKHVAALLFTAEDHPTIRAQLLSQAPGIQTSRVGSGQQGGSARPAWEQALNRLITKPGTAPSAAGIQLALQFEVEEPAAHFSYTGRRDPMRSVRQLKARPVMMGAKGKWIRGDVSWNNLSYVSFRREFNEVHVEWLQTFLAAHGSSNGRQQPSGAMWLSLNDFAAKNLWTLLADATKAGIPLIHSAGSEPVRVEAQPAVVGLSLARLDAASDAQAEAHDGGLQLAPSVTVGGEPVDA